MVNDSGLPDEIAPSARQHLVQELPEETLVYLLGSRYCETDRLSDIAWSLFGTTPLGWARVQAICDFVHNHITFGYEHARATKTAWEAYNERKGVCRDYAHLAVSFCRCMNIPARYCTGYLGDIGVPPSADPMDFSAWFEAYLGGRWYTFDARNNIPRIGRVLIARGRDASDVAISSTFGPNTLASFKVWTDEVRQGAPSLVRSERPGERRLDAPEGGRQALRPDLGGGLAPQQILPDLDQHAGKPAPLAVHRDGVVRGVGDRVGLVGADDQLRLAGHGVAQSLGQARIVAPAEADRPRPVAAGQHRREAVDAEQQTRPAGGGSRVEHGCDRLVVRPEQRLHPLLTLGTAQPLIARNRNIGAHVGDRIRRWPAAGCSR